MTREQRDELLEAVTEDVVAHVLYDSFLQAQIIGQEVERSAARLYAYEDLMGAARGAGRCSTAAPRTCPTPRRSPSAGAPGRGMERPELAVLVAYAKRWVARALEALDVHRRPVAGARPARATSRPRWSSAAGTCWASTRCAGSCCAWPARTRVVNALGPTFVSQLVAERGCDAGRRRARLPDRPRGDRRGGALGRGRAARGRRARGAGRADGRRRRDRRQRDALVPRPGRPRATSRR